MLAYTKEAEISSTASKQNPLGDLQQIKNAHEEDTLSLPDPDPPAPDWAAESAAPYN